MCNAIFICTCINIYIYIYIYYISYIILKKTGYMNQTKPVNSHSLKA